MKVRLKNIHRKYKDIVLNENLAVNKSKSSRNVGLIKTFKDIATNDIPDLLRRGAEYAKESLDSKELQNNKLIAETDKISSQTDHLNSKLQLDYIEKVKKVEEIEKLKLENKIRRMKIRVLRKCCKILDKNNVLFYIDQQEEIHLINV